MNPTMGIVIIGADPTTAARIATESTAATMGIMATGNTPMIAAAITGTTITTGGNMNTAAIGAHGMIGTGMPEGFPTCTNTGTTTGTTPI